MVEKVRKRLQYRKVTGLKDGRTLQGLLGRALKHQYPAWHQRMQEVKDIHGAVTLNRTVNYCSISDGALFGELILYAPGTNKPAVTIDDHEEFLDVTKVALPKDRKGREREFIDSVLYFAIVDDHLAIIQSLGLQARDFEFYLNWLLFEKSQSLKAGEAVTLEKEISASKEVLFQDVKSVKIGAPLFSDLHAAESDTHPTSAMQGQTKVSKGLTVEMSGEGMSWLSKILGADLIKKLKHDNLSGADNLIVEVTVTRKGGSTKDGNSSQRAMAAITKQLRHQHDDDIEVESRTLGTVRGNTLFLSTHKMIVADAGIPARHSVFEALRDWLKDCLNDGLLPD